MTNEIEAVLEGGPLDGQTMQAVAVDGIGQRHLHLTWSTVTAQLAGDRREHDVVYERHRPGDEPDRWIYRPAAGTPSP